jgi:hypothetical protein
MEEHYNTVEKLASHPEIEKFVAWVRTKQPGLKVRSRRPKAS